VAIGICSEDTLHKSLTDNIPLTYSTWHVSGAMVVSKPASGKVNGEPRLSARDWSFIAYLQRQYKIDKDPLLHSSTNDYGFVDHLDAPSSGLILVGSSFHGLQYLMHQVDMQYLQRNYVVVCRGLAIPGSSKLTIQDRVCQNPEDGTYCMSPQIRCYVQAHLRFRPRTNCKASKTHAYDETIDFYTLCAIAIQEGRDHSCRLLEHHSSIAHSLASSAFTRDKVIFQLSP